MPTLIVGKIMFATRLGTYDGADCSYTVETLPPGIRMQNRQRKIVVLGAVLIAVSFLVGLFHSFMPLMFLHLAEMAFDLFIFFCYGLFGIVFLGIAATVFAIAALFLNPFGVMFMLGVLGIVISRKPGLSR